MAIGFIDFSDSDRKITQAVLQSLHEKEVVDELGVSPIRDGFAELLFPGTSTLHTRAIYFLIVPYALKDIENEVLNFKSSDKKQLLEELRNIEKKCCEKFLEDNPDEEGIIGKRAWSLDKVKWLKRTPLDIYLAGIRRYKILASDDTLNEFIERLLANQKQKRSVKENVNRRGDAEYEGEDDDKDTMLSKHRKSLLDIPCYDKNWFDHLKINLSKEETKFLKEQIIKNCEGTLLACILQNHMNIDNINTFEELQNILNIFSLDNNLRRNYNLALEFSNFWKTPQTIYNIIISNGRNEEANRLFEEQKGRMSKDALINLKEVFDTLGLKQEANGRLWKFLNKLKNLMLDNKFDELRDEIIARESQLKGSRAKTKRIGEFGDENWYGGFGLSYRFGNAKTIIKDIFEGEN